VTSLAYTSLQVWQRAMDLVVGVYHSTQSFPRQEVYGLTAQMRRAAVSIPSNIAEGKGRFSRKELVHFLLNARGSLLELETQVSIAHRLGYLDQEQSRNLSTIMDEVARLLNGLLNRFRDVA
jgi:four helix bundle protein